MYYYYKYKDKLFFSHKEYPHMDKAFVKDLINSNEIIYYLHEKSLGEYRDSYSITDMDLFDYKTEDISLIKSNEKHIDTPHWIKEKVQLKKICAINTNYPNWKKIITKKNTRKFTINILGLGDVGATLAIGLRLLGKDMIKKIGIYNVNEKTLNRWNYELNQIYSTDRVFFPEVKMINRDELFNCDLFAFCASAFVPKVGEKVDDVRMIQLEKNAKIIGEYAKMARDANFNGIFAVVSDPVDLLCKAAFLKSNTSEDGTLDYKGLLPSQVQGYGLGVMHARALYYSKEIFNCENYEIKGRAFGPHGEGLIIANDIYNYDEESSLILTDKTKKANLDVRATGFKPFIAPALSSGSLSILATLSGDWNYSATYLGGVFMGCKNKRLDSGIELERVLLHDSLYDKLEDTYIYLKNII